MDRIGNRRFLVEFAWFGRLGNFIVDHHPENPNVCFAAGLSGHGFKFTTVLGEILADYAEGKNTDLPVGFLGLERF